MGVQGSYFPLLGSSQSAGQPARAWPRRKGHSVRSVVGVYVCGDGLDFTPDGRQILTASHRGKDALQVWDVGTVDLVKKSAPREALELKRADRASELRWECFYSVYALALATSWDLDVSFIHLSRLPHP